MILIDTSLWIFYFNSPKSRQAQLIEELLISHQPVCINAIIEMEVLQGISKDSQYNKMREHLADFQYFPDFNQKYFNLATEIYRTCRKQGVTVRKSLDCLIAANCLIDNLEILHHDRDFEQIKKVFHSLRSTSI